MKDYSKLMKKQQRMRLFCGVGAVLLAVILMANWIVLAQGGAYCFGSTDHFSAAKGAVVLGTDNPSAIERRAKAAISLLRSGRIPKIVVSGSPNNHGHNEVQMIADYLAGAGIAPSVIDFDQDGTTTRRSIKSAKRKFGSNKVILVTDDYHGPRAAFLARHAGLNASCLIAKTTWGTHALFRVHVREYLSRVKAVIEIYLLGY